MIRTFNSKQDGTFAGRTITVLVISATVLLGGTVFGYAATTIHGVGSTAVSIGGPSHLMAPLTDASVSAGLETAAVSPSATSNEMAPLSVSTSVDRSSHLNGPLK